MLALLHERRAQISITFEEKLFFKINQKERKYSVTRTSDFSYVTLANIDLRKKGIEIFTSYCQLRRIWKSVISLTRAIAC